MGREDELERSEIEALLETRRELGPTYDQELVDSFADRIERAVEERTSAGVSRRSFAEQAQVSAGKRQLALGIVTGIVGIPVTALSLAIDDGSLAAMVVGWAGLVGINVAHSVQSRPRS